MVVSSHCLSGNQSRCLEHQKLLLNCLDCLEGQTLCSGRIWRYSYLQGLVSRLGICPPGWKEKRRLSIFMVWPIVIFHHIFFKQGKNSSINLHNFSPIATSQTKLFPSMNLQTCKLEIFCYKFLVSISTSDDVKIGIVRKVSWVSLKIFSLKMKHIFCNVS